MNSLKEKLFLQLNKQTLRLKNAFGSCLEDHFYCTRKAFFKTELFRVNGALFLFYFLFLTFTYADFKWTPVAKVSLLGGQIFFEGQNTSFTGNGDWLLAPGMKFSEKITLIPTISGKYRRMREVQELIGGGFLTRQTFENTLSLKGIYKFNDQWKSKLKGTFKNQFLVESADEELGKGLYDNQKIGFGFELERNGTLFKSVRLSFDPYQLQFIRYKTLSSGSQFGSEIKSGENTLDFNAYDTTLAAEVPIMAKLTLTGSTLFSYRIYSDQKTVTSAGLYTDSLRKDIYSLSSVGASYSLPNFEYNDFELQTVAGLDLSYTLQDSDQHNYDAARTKFNENYYDYGEYGITPKIASRLFEKLDVVLSYGYTRRSYVNRVIQSSDGTYKTKLLYTNYHTFNYSFKYPLLYGLSANAQGVYRKATSNMEFEKTYRYTYNTQHYYLGLSWEY